MNFDGEAVMNAVVDDVAAWRPGVGWSGRKRHEGTSSATVSWSRVHPVLPWTAEHAAALFNQFESQERVHSLQAQKEQTWHGEGHLLRREVASPPEALVQAHIVV